MPEREHLLLYASRDGQTERIAVAIADCMKEAGLSVQLQNLEGMKKAFRPEGYKSVLIGAPIRYGYHLRSARDFIATHTDWLGTVPGGFFSVNLTARKPEKNTPETNLYMKKFLRKSPWQPSYQGVIAGSLLYSRYPWYDRVMIQLIMKITGGNTDASKDIEYTDWDSVHRFAKGYIDYLHQNDV